MLRGSLCREGPKAQEWRLWKPPVLRTKFWIQFIGLQKTTMDVEGWQVAKSATIAARGNNSPPERACRRERDALDPECGCELGTIGAQGSAHTDSQTATR